MDGLGELVFYLGSQYVSSDNGYVVGIQAAKYIGHFIQACSSAYFFLLGSDKLTRIIGERDNVERLEVLPPFREPAVSLAIGDGLYTSSELSMEEYREGLQKICSMITPGGALILIDRVSTFLQEPFCNARLSMTGQMLQPLERGMTAIIQEAELHKAGFSFVDCFYRNLDVGAWLATKSS